MISLVNLKAGIYELDVGPAARTRGMAVFPVNVHTIPPGVSVVATVRNDGDREAVVSGLLLGKVAGAEGVAPLGLDGALTLSPGRMGILRGALGDEHPDGYQIQRLILSSA